MTALPHRLLAAAMLACAIASCSSGKSGQSADDYGPTYRQRLASADNAMRKGDFSQRSSFESTSGYKQKDKGGVKTGTFSGSTFSGGDKKFYSGTKPVKEKQHFMAGRSSTMGDDAYSGAGKEAHSTTSSFKTSTSRYDGSKSRESGRGSSYDDDVFRTRAEPSAAKAMQTSRRPYIEQSSDPSYTEAQVKGLLNKP